MGLLTTSQRDAMASRNPRYRHQWQVGRPPSSGSEVYQFAVLHDDATGSGRVTDPGQREYEAYNQSLQEPGKLPTALYTITCANQDGLLYPTKAGNIWRHTGGYQADPVECLLLHLVFVWAGGTWSLLTPCTYIGEVREVSHSGHTKETTIQTQARVMRYLIRQWVDEDGVLYEPSLQVYAATSGPA